MDLLTQLHHLRHLDAPQLRAYVTESYAAPVDLDRGLLREYAMYRALALDAQAR